MLTATSVYFYQMLTAANSNASYSVLRSELPIWSEQELTIQSTLSTRNLDATHALRLLILRAFMPVFKAFHFVWLSTHIYQISGPTHRLQPRSSVKAIAAQSRSCLSDKSLQSHDILASKQHHAQVSVHIRKSAPLENYLYMST